MSAAWRISFPSLNKRAYSDLSGLTTVSYGSLTEQGFAVVTLDKDFSDLALLLGEPPKVIWLRCGNSTVSEVENHLRRNFDAIERFHRDPYNAVLEIWP